MRIKQVIGARIVLKRVEAEQATKSGIILPDKVAEENRARQGTVVLIGDGISTDKGVKIPVEIPLNAEVLYREFAGFELKDGDDTYVIINEGDVLCVLES